MTQGRPTAAPAHFPYDHPSMAVVMAEERRAEFADIRAKARLRLFDKDRYERERRAIAMPGVVG